MTDQQEQALFRNNAVRSFILVGLALVAILSCYFLAPIGTAPQAGVVLKLPEELLGYQVKEGVISEGEKAVLPPDTGFARMIYTNPNSESITASIILSGAERRSIHRPEVCLPAQGWIIKESKTVHLEMKDKGMLPIRRLRVTKNVRLPNGQAKELVAYIFYTFIGKETVTASHWMRIWVTSYDRVVHRLNHRWAYLLMQELVTEGLKPGGLNEEQTIRHMEEVTREIVPAFMLVKLKPRN